MGRPTELLEQLNDLSSRLHACGKDSFPTDNEVEAWEVACGAVDSLRTMVAARTERAEPDEVLKAERRGLISRLIGRIEEDEDKK